MVASLKSHLRHGICVPVGWQIYARQEKASGRTFFSDKPTVVFTTVGSKNSWFKEKKVLPLAFSCQA